MSMVSRVSAGSLRCRLLGDSGGDDESLQSHLSRESEEEGGRRRREEVVCHCMTKTRYLTPNSADQMLQIMLSTYSN